jgi:prolipoprotein diacylglyceryltransferase
MSVYLIGYGFWRIIIEFFRTDQRGAMILGLAPSQWQSMLFIAGGIALYVIYVIKKWPIFFKEGEELALKEQTEKADLEKDAEEK